MRVFHCLSQTRSRTYLYMGYGIQGREQRKRERVPALLLQPMSQFSRIMCFRNTSFRAERSLPRLCTHRKEYACFDSLISQSSMPVPIAKVNVLFQSTGHLAGAGEMCDNYNPQNWLQTHNQMSAATRRARKLRPIVEVLT